MVYYIILYYIILYYIILYYIILYYIILYYIILYYIILPQKLPDFEERNRFRFEFNKNLGFIMSLPTLLSLVRHYIEIPKLDE